MAGRTKLAAAAIVVATVSTGCATEPPPRPPPAAVYELVPRTVRPHETPLRPVATTDGETAFELIGLTTGLPSVLGHHTEWPAKGQFVRVRLVISNTARNSIPFDANRQLLSTADGATHAPDSQAMLIRRQPARIDLGSGNRVEFDLYYDIPAEATPAGLRVFGGPTLADFADATGTDIPL